MMKDFVKDDDVGSGKFFERVSRVSYECNICKMIA